ncbi:MAG: HIT family protein [Actinomycetota bacterium]|nr:HIT family protein [Actinomycetota bacterium]
MAGPLVREGCIFCKILAGEASSSMVFEDNACVAFLDVAMIRPGHTLVVPKDHAPRLSELDPEVGARLFRTGQKVAAALYGSLGCDGINLFLADGEAAGQDVFHAHLHVLPRFEGDGLGSAFRADEEKMASREELDEVAEKIRNSFQRL